MVTKKSQSKKKYGQGAQEEVKKEMHQYKKGEAMSGTGKKIKNPKQAIAIGLSKARKKGVKVPKKRT